MLIFLAWIFPMVTAVQKICERLKNMRALKIRMRRFFLVKF